MRTISQASDGPSGKATELLSIPKFISSAEPQECPVTLSSILDGKNWQEYLGHYHTDHTVPSAFFRSDVRRPADVPSHVLDFTYLCNRNVDNPDFFTMAEGQQIRDDDQVEHVTRPTVPSFGRLCKMVEEEVRIDQAEQLMKAIGLK
jgi:hypothetical protein